MPARGLVFYSSTQLRPDIMPKDPRHQFEGQLAPLVDKFAKHHDEYLRPSYSETEVRAEFIDKLFEALGWDVYNEAGRSPKMREVFREAGETHGRVDYAFRIDGRDVFYVEAKAPHVPLDRADVVLQAKRYAWHSPNVFVAAVTDFEEFRLYDATARPDPKHPHAGLIFKHEYADYLQPKSLDDLWLLSRASVAARSIDQLLKKSSVQARQRIPVDQAFLDDLSEWREQLAKAVFKANPELSPADLNNVVQVFLDRLIFVRICEDRRIMAPRQLAEVAENWEFSGKRASITTDLNALFHDVNDRLNGEIFKPHLCEKIDWDINAALVAGIIKGLYFPASPYLFDKIPVEVLGSIYERYLGKTIRVTETRAIVEDKPEARKAGGVYYTPRYIVDYIVDQTVGKLIQGKTPKQIETLRILDPACGSGSFLIGAYSKLLDYHEQYYIEHARARGGNSAQPRLIPAEEGGEFKLSLAEKAAILRNNIFGVDIDPQAVEITMMSLYIKMLEDERGILSGRALLPRLRDNIKCGNSLVSYDIGELSEEDRARINPFDWNSKSEGFGEIMAAGGFDAVIGNPPYGASFGSREAGYFRHKYKTFGGVKDVYTCFVEAALALLKRHGRHSFIVPSAWLGGPQYGALRNLLRGYQLETILLLPFDVFPDAYVDTAIFVLYGQAADASHKVRTYTFPKRAKLSDLILPESDYKLVPQLRWGADEGGKFILDPGAADLLDEIRKTVAGTFDDVLLIKRGVLFDRSLLTTRKTSRDSYRYFEGDVYRYQLNFQAARWVEFGPKMQERPRELIWFEGARILLRRLVNRRQRLMATLVTDTFITNKNLYSALAKQDAISISAILGVLNSRLISYLYINQVTQATKDDFPQVTIKDIVRLPFPSFPEKARLGEMVALVERMLDLQKKSRQLRATARVSASSGKST